METCSNCDDISDLGYQPSPSSFDQSETPGFSTTSGDSFLLRRTFSETSSLSLDETNSFTSEPSPSHWLPATTAAAVKHAVLGRSEMKQRKSIVNDDQESVDNSGNYH